MDFERRSGTALNYRKASSRLLTSCKRFAESPMASLGGLETCPGEKWFNQERSRMKNLLVLLGFMLLFALSPAIAQDAVTLRQVTMVDDAKTSLNSDKKDKLAMSVSGRGFVGSIFLMPKTAVKIISRQSFTTRESVGATAKQVNRNFTVALIEVLDGEHKGKKGWAVIDVQDEGRRKDTYIGPGQAVSSASRAEAASNLDSSVDLVVSVGAGHISPTGGRLYEVGVVNKGGVVHKGAIEVVVEINGKVVKTERLRGPLKPNQVASFTLPVGDTDLRNKVTIKATVDPNNTVAEADEKNNTATTTARP